MTAISAAANRGTRTRQRSRVGSGTARAWTELSHLTSGSKQQREQARDQEQEDDVKDTARDYPDQQEQDRKPDELDPARDLDLGRRARGHRADRTVAAVRRPPGVWDWSLDTDGSLARAPGAPKAPQLSGRRRRFAAGGSSLGRKLARRRPPPVDAPGHLGYGAPDAVRPGLPSAGASRVEDGPPRPPPRSSVDRRAHRTGGARRRGVPPRAEPGGRCRRARERLAPAPRRPAEPARRRHARAAAHPAADQPAQGDGDRLPRRR